MDDFSSWLYSWYMYELQKRDPEGTGESYNYRKSFVDDAKQRFFGNQFLSAIGYREQSWIPGTNNFSMGWKTSDRDRDRIRTLFKQFVKPLEEMLEYRLNKRLTYGRDSYANRHRFWLIEDGRRYFKEFKDRRKAHEARRGKRQLATA